MPRMGLTPERVVAVAVELADRSGPQDLSLADLASHLGVRVPSLYKHVGGLDDLRQQVADVGMAGLAAAVGRAADGRQGRDALVSLAQAYRRFARIHPGQYRALVRASGPGTAHFEDAQRITQVISRVVGDYKLNRDVSADAVRMIRSSLHGFASLEAVGGFGRSASVEASFYSMIATLDHALGGSTAPAKSLGGGWLARCKSLAGWAPRGGSALLGSLLRPIR